MLPGLPSTRRLHRVSHRPRTRRATNMKRTVTLALVVASCVSTAAADWTAFRGKHGNGASASEKAPTNIRDRGNIRWAADLPGRGLSSPIIIDQKIYITCSSGPEQKVLHVLCFDDATG